MERDNGYVFKKYGIIVGLVIISLAGFAAAFGHKLGEKFGDTVTSPNTIDSSLSSVPVGKNGCKNLELDFTVIRTRRSYFKPNPYGVVKILRNDGSQFAKEYIAKRSRRVSFSGTFFSHGIKVPKHTRISIWLGDKRFPKSRSKSYGTLTGAFTKSFKFKNKYYEVKGTCSQ